MLNEFLIKNSLKMIQNLIIDNVNIKLRFSIFFSIFLIVCTILSKIKKNKISNYVNVYFFYNDTEMINFQKKLFSNTKHYKVEHNKDNFLLIYLENKMFICFMLENVSKVYLDNVFRNLDKILKLTNPNEEDINIYYDVSK